MKNRDMENKEYTSADYQAIAREHKEALETNKRIFIKSAIFVILTALVIILAVLAWFAMNNRTESIPSIISAMSSRYSIVTGRDGDNVGIWERGNTLLIFDTTDKMSVNEDSNFKNTNETSKLSPGSFGELTFTVDPIANDLGEIEVIIETNLQLRKNDDNTQILSDDDAVKVARYMNGHMLFFTAKNGRYYSGWIKPDKDDKYKLTIPSSDFKDADGKTTKSVSRTIYWIWPQQFHNYVYTGGGSYYRNLFETEQSVGYSDLISDMQDNKSRYFKGELPSVQINSNMSGADYNTCTDAFNEADQLIGEGVEFIQIRINTSENGGGA